MEVALVRWPDGQGERDALNAARRPVLLLVETGPPPLILDLLEDWIRVPATEADLESRLQSLRMRADHVDELTEHFGDDYPLLAGDGILTVGERSVRLPPLEAALVAKMLERPGGTVTRQALIEAVGAINDDDGQPRPTLDTHLHRLRRRLAVVGLTIRAIRSRGYMMGTLPAERLG